jgi:hypothetical protein
MAVVTAKLKIAAIFPKTNSKHPVWCEPLLVHNIIDGDKMFGVRVFLREQAE